MSSRDAAKKRPGSTIDDATQGRSGGHGPRARRAAASARPAGAAPAQDDDPGYVSVIEVSGLLDRVLVDFIETQITEAEDGGAIALVLQLNSAGRRWSPTSASTSWSTASSAPASRSTSGSAPRAARPAATPPRCSPRPGPSASRRAAASRSPRVLLGDGTLDGQRRRRRHGERRRGRRPRPGRQRRPHASASSCSALDGVREPSVGRRRRPRSPSPRPGSPSSRSAASSCTRCPARRWPTCCSSSAWRSSCSSSSPPASAWPAWWAPGCLVLGCYGLAALPTNPAGVGPAPVRHVRLRHRRADRRATGLERHRHRVASRSAR